MGRSRSRSRGPKVPWLWVVLCVALIIVGAPVGPGSGSVSEAFTSASSDRGSSVDVAGDSGGLFGLDVASSVAAGTTSRLVTVTNNADQSVTFTVDTSVGTVPDSQRTLQPKESFVVSVNVACESGDTVRFSINGVADDRFSGSMTRSTDVDTDGCEQAPAPISGADATAGGNNGKADLALQNTGSAPLTIVGIEFTDTNSSATEVTSPGDLTANGSLEYTGGAFSFDTRVNMTTSQTLASGDAVGITVDKFRNSGGNGNGNVDMSGTYLEFIVYLSSGEEATLRVMFPQ